MTPGVPRVVTIALMTPVTRPWLDWAIAAALTAIGIAITVDPGNGDGTIVDSFVIGAVTLPVIWRRRAPLYAAAALAAGTVISGIPTFDQVRCGVAIPAALLILFSVAARRPRGEALAGLGLVLAGIVVLLFTDPQLDVGAAFILPLSAGVWWTGRLERSRSRVAAELAERSQRLAETREDTARLAVEGDRAAIAADLEVAAQRPLRAMVELADAGAAQVDGGPELARETFASIERQGRDSLNEMRQMLGALRSDERDTAPQPTLADLDTLLARARRSGVAVELTASGERRPLPAGIELAAYRVVQHALEALPGTQRGTVHVVLRYLSDAIELEIRGPLADGNAAEAALAAARERVTAHGGSFSRERGADLACVLRSRLPVAPAGG
jgi:signal transduction histidine kinase